MHRTGLARAVGRASRLCLSKARRRRAEAREEVDILVHFPVKNPKTFGVFPPLLPPNVRPINLVDGPWIED